MRVLVAGGGKAGVFIANDLALAGHEVYVVEQAEGTLEKSTIEEGITWFHADACEYNALEQIGADKCDAVVAATGDDEDNLVISLLAKQEFGVPRVIARVNHPENEWLFTANWGVDVAVSQAHLLTALVEEAVSVGQFVHLLKLKGGKVDLVEVTLAPGAPVAGKSLAEITLSRDATIVAVIREDRVIMPKGDTRLQAGDEVLALVTNDSREEVRALLEGEKGH